MATARDLQRQRAAVLAVWRAECTGRRVGGWADLGGVQVHSTGVPVQHWNGAFPTGPDVDLGPLVPRVEAWFDERAVPWGLLVPDEWRLVPPGLAHVHTQPVMLRPLEEPLPGRATDLALSWDAPVADLAAVQAEAFGDPYDATLAFLAPSATSAAHETVVAYDGEQPAGCATAVVTGDVAGVYGVAVRPAWRRRGLGAALTVAVLERARRRGCDLAHLNPSDAGKGVYAALGFVDAPPYRVWVRP